MGADTRARGAGKLGQFTPKIGYPDQWRDYSALEVRAGDLLGNVRRAVAFEVDRELAKLGGPVDRDEWFMTPQTVNAYYNPGLNEIVFPAAILQPPFFDLDADDAVNYGGIGAVIGHEIGHGFDDQGSQYDGDGNLRDWWTDEDRAAFEARADALIAQYDDLVPATPPATRSTARSPSARTSATSAASRSATRPTGSRSATSRPPSSTASPASSGSSSAGRRSGAASPAGRRPIRLLAVDPHCPPDLRGNAVATSPSSTRRSGSRRRMRCGWQRSSASASSERQGCSRGA